MPKWFLRITHRYRSFGYDPSGRNRRWVGSAGQGQHARHEQRARADFLQGQGTIAGFGEAERDEFAWLYTRPQSNAEIAGRIRLGRARGQAPRADDLSPGDGLFLIRVGFLPDYRSLQGDRLGLRNPRPKHDPGHKGGRNGADAHPGRTFLPACHGLASSYDSRNGEGRVSQHSPAVIFMAPELPSSTCAW